MKRRPHAGFTLIEMLLALSLLALLLGLAWTSMRAAIGSSRSGEALIARTEQLRSVQGFMRRQLTQALPIAFERVIEVGNELRFEGSDRELRFVAPMPGYLSRGGAHVQTLRLVGGGRGQRLEFDHAQLNGFDSDNPVYGAEPVVLLEGIADGRFEFRSFDETGRFGDWHSDWELSDRLPLMVRLQLRFERDDARQWPEFEVTLMAAASGVQPVGFTQRRQREVRVPAGNQPQPRRPGRP